VGVDEGLLDGARVGVVAKTWIFPPTIDSRLLIEIW
jgi:hypothetical protein